MGDAIRDVKPKDYAAILAANLQYVDWLSPLARDDLHTLIAASSCARVITAGRGSEEQDSVGVLIGFTSDSRYQSANLNWLRDKFDRFVYVDRVIVSQSAQGKGWGRRLYQDLETFARANDYLCLVCEINTVPNNPDSHVFHERMGFVACGAHVIKDGIKAVRYYAKPLR